MSEIKHSEALKALEDKLPDGVFIDKVDSVEIEPRGPFATHGNGLHGFYNVRLRVFLRDFQDGGAVVRSAIDAGQ